MVAVRVALTWATNVQKMLSDAKRFKKELKCVETNVVASSVCVKFSFVGDSQLCRKTVYSVFFKKKLLVFRIDFGVSRLFLI